MERGEEGREGIDRKGKEKDWEGRGRKEEGKGKIRK